MRGRADRQQSMFIVFDLEQRIPDDHPLRPIKRWCDKALAAMSRDFDKAYGDCGPRSIPPESLIKCLLLRALFGIPGERKLCEACEFNMLSRWFIDWPIKKQMSPQSIAQQNRADSTREERRYYFQNRRADVVTLLTDTGKMVEWVKYSAYGVPFALPAGDTDSDGDWDATDAAAIMQGGAYDVRKDAELDGDIDASDAVHANSITGGHQTLGRGVLSSSAVNNRRGYAGYEYDPTFEGAGRHLYHVCHRVYDADVGRWTRRDPLGYVDGMSLYAYGAGIPLRHSDPSGLRWIPCDGEGCQSGPGGKVDGGANSGGGGGDDDSGGADGRRLISCPYPTTGHFMRMRCDLWVRCMLVKMGLSPQDPCWASLLAGGTSCCMNNGTYSRCQQQLIDDYVACVPNGHPCFMKTPQPPNDAWCNAQYAPCDCYTGANARYFCKCGGDGPWPNFVRACLACCTKAACRHIRLIFDAMRRLRVDMALPMEWAFVMSSVSLCN